MKNKIFFAIDLIIPIAIFIIGILLLLAGAVINLYHLLVFIVLPVVMVCISVLYYLVVESKFLKFLIILFLYVPIVLALFLAFFLFSSLSLKAYDDVDELCEKYEVVQCESDFLPEINDIGDTQSLAYYHVGRFYSIMFYSESDVLVCEYGEAEYLAQKAAIEEKYVFETRIDERNDSYDQYVCYPYAEIDGFLFRRLADEEGAEMYSSYPKEVHIVGTNDETREIVYLDFYDFDLDYISDFTRFIKVNCGWDAITHDRLIKNFTFDGLIDFFKNKIAALGV